MSPAVHVKSDDAVAPGFFEVEAAGLAWLAQAHPRGGVAVVRVLDVGPGRIALERLPTTRPTPDAARDFGARLALTHRAGAGWFGCPPGDWPGDGFIGTAPLPHLHSADDADAATWGRFYAECRLRPYLDAALAAETLRAADARAVHEVLDALRADDTAVCGLPEPVARIHGDLWSGNVLWTPTGAVVIDPAAHGGHRETDLAMLALFGLAYLGEVLAGYDAVWPLAPGWRERVPLHQLHPLLVHTVLFGGSYGVEAGAAARAALRRA